MTGLFNRKAFFLEAEKRIQQEKPGFFILSHFNIDNFKVVNDQYGHEIGDRLLRHLADCIAETAEKTDGVAGRISGDKFALLFPAKYINSETIRTFHKKIPKLDFLQQPITVRIGRYKVDDTSLSVEVMFDRAGLAEASIQGKYNLLVAEYDDSMREQLIYEQSIVTRMEDALRTGQFEPFFQPQYNHATGALIGAEALVRWRDPENNLIIPTIKYINVFEKNGFIYELDRFIWEQVCIDIRKWLDEGREVLPVSVNISRLDIFHSDFMDVITGLISKYDLPIDLLRLEVTESAFSEKSSDVVTVVKQLIEFGFTVEIDDFGSGYSSLNTLKDVPAQILKLDMKFFENTDNSKRGGNIIESVVRMAKWLDMAVIAEGVEKKEQADYLHSIGCDYIQGYYYAKPMPLNEYEKKLDENAKDLKLDRLETVKGLDNNAFWDPNSLDTLIFNSYVGGSCIFEYRNGEYELLRLNDRYSQVLGCFAPEGNKILGHSAIPLYLHGKDKEILQEMIDKAIETRHEESCEVVLTDPDVPEKIEYVRIMARVIASTSDRYLFYCGVENLTKQRIAEKIEREAEKRAQESAQQLQTIMSNLNGGVSAVRLGEDGRLKLLYCNDLYYDIFGYTKQYVEEEHLDMLDLIMAEDYPMLIKRVRQMMEDRMPAQINYRSRTRDGKQIYIQVSASITSLSGYDDVVISVITDVTQQKLLSDQLQAIVENMYGGVVVAAQENGKLTFILSNDQYYATFGYTREQFESEVPDPYMLIVPEDRDKIRQIYIQSLKERDRFTMEFSAVRRDGSLCHVHSCVSLVDLFGLDTPVQLSMLTDVTELYASEQREHETAVKLQAIMGNIDGGVSAIKFGSDNEVELIYANDSYYEMFGYTREQFEIELSNAVELVYPQDLKNTMEFVEKLVRDRGSAAYEYRCVKRDGSIIWIQCRNTVISLDGVGDTVLLAVTTDITALRDAEAKQRELASRLQLIMDNISSAISVASINGNDVYYRFSNERYFELVGYTEKEYFEKFHDTFGPMLTEDRARVIKTISRAIQSGEEARFDYRIIRGDGELRWIRHRLISTEIEGTPGKVQFSVMDDITETKMAELEALQAGEKMNTVMDHINNGVIAFTMKGDEPELVLANDRFFEMSGFAREDRRKVIGSNIIASVYQDDREQFFSVVHEAIRNKENVSLQFRFIRPDGRLLWVKMDVSTISITGIDAPVHIGVFTDITDRIASEEKQNELLDNLPCGAAMYEFDGKELTIIHLNRQYWEMVGRDPQDEESITVLDAVHPSDKAGIMTAIESAIWENHNVECDVRILYGTGDYRPFHIVGRLVPMDDGRYMIYTAYTANF